MQAPADLPLSLLPAGGQRGIALIMPGPQCQPSAEQAGAGDVRSDIQQCSPG